MSVVADLRPIPLGASGTSRSVQYHEFECSKCGVVARNTYCEPHRTDMLARRLCWTCNFWVDEEAKLTRDHVRMTIIDGHIYGPGNRTEGSFRGMAGRRFDIEYIKPSSYAGQRCTTFDLWSGSTLPPELAARFPDTAKFLNGAERFPATEARDGCWNPSSNAGDPYPPPSKLVSNKEPVR